MRPLLTGLLLLLLATHAQARAEPSLSPPLPPEEARPPSLDEPAPTAEAGTEPGPEAEAEAEAEAGTVPSPEAEAETEAAPLVAPEAPLPEREPDGSHGAEPPPVESPAPEGAPDEPSVAPHEPTAQAPEAPSTALADVPVPAASAPAPAHIQLSQPAAPTQPTVIQQPPVANLAENLLPRPPRANLLRAVLLLLSTLGFVGLGNLAERPLGRFTAHGLLPSTLKLLVVVFRSGALLLAFVGLLHLVPNAWSPAVAYVLVGTALALGWSVREVVQDVVVGLIFTLEHSFQAGQRIRFEGTTGTLQRMTFRVTWLRTDEGADIAIPNHKLTNVTMELDPAPYAPVSVLLLVPACQSSVEARNTIRELVLLNPYLAPGADPQVHRQADDPQRWLVKARLLDARYADRFRGTMVDLVEEVFGPPSGPCGCEERTP